jgi:hypothetical protein
VQNILTQNVKQIGFETQLKGMKAMNQIRIQQFEQQQILQNKEVNQMRTVTQNRTKYNTQRQDWERP